MREKELFYRLTMLGSKWAEKEKDLPIRDWAGNDNWDDTSDIDIFLLLLRKDHPKRKLFELAKKILRLKGVAQYVGTSREYGDRLTPLAILAGEIKQEKYED